MSVVNVPFHILYNRLTIAYLWLHICLEWIYVLFTSLVLQYQNNSVGWKKTPPNI